MRIRGWIWVLLGGLGLGCASPLPDAAQPQDRYVFAWPFADTAALAPRGGTTRGPAVTVSTTPSAAWVALRAEGLASQARDRAAILAMAGDYRTSFDFLETVLYEPGASPARPYRSWGTERIDVLEVREDFVSLQHTLVMFVETDTGETIGPLVQKHWRQDWAYEPAQQLAFLGERRFGMREVPAEQRRGAWSQTVYQVDDSPRFANTGRWSHDGQRSVWDGASAWRPLPRRESSVRDDYHVLAGRHRITVLPTGWVHEQENEKLALAAGAPPTSRGREIGVNRYEQIRDFDFSAADAYWQATGYFWQAIREEWAARIAGKPEVELRNRCSDVPGFQLSFGYAARLEGGWRPEGHTAIRTEAVRIVHCLAGGS